MSAKERPMEDIREKILAGNLGTMGFGQVEVGRTPRSTPRNNGSGRPRRSFSIRLSSEIDGAQHVGNGLCPKV